MTRIGSIILNASDYHDEIWNLLSDEFDLPDMFAPEYERFDLIKAWGLLIICGCKVELVDIRYGSEQVRIEYDGDVGDLILRIKAWLKS